MKKTVISSVLLFIGGCCLLPGYLYAQQSQMDTAEVYKHIEEVVVSGKRPERFSPGSRTLTIDSTRLNWYTSGTLSDLLAFSLPVYFKSYGPGMLSSIAFRGTSASHTAVLWNGFNINQPSNGQTDFALLPVIAQNTIDIQYGNAGTNYGSAAIGGAVLLSSPLPFNKGYSAGIQQTVGSFDMYNTILHTKYSNHNLSLQTKLFHQRSENNFSFNNITRFGNPSEKQVNAALQQYGVTQDIALSLNANNLLTIRGWYNYNNRQIPPAMGSSHRNARQKEENLRLLTEWNRFTRSGNTSVRIAFFDEKLIYTEEQLNSNTHIQTIQSQAEHEYSYKDKLTVKAGVELQQFYARVDGYGEDKQESRGSAFLLTKLKPFHNFQASINFRQALVEGYNPPFTPSAGLLYTFLNYRSHSFSIKSNAARSYRVPTLNERFWQVGGNLNIKPEKSWSYENGLVHQWKKEHLILNSELTHYFMKVDDWIQWQPTMQGFWSPVSVMQVNPKGIEFTSDLNFRSRRIKGILGTAYSYTASTISKSYSSTMQDTGKQLMYVPLHNGVAYGNLDYRGFMVGANLSYTGFRYTSNSNTDWLNSYMLMNIIAGKTLYYNHTSFHISGKINNLLDKSYQNMENRPMPGRNFQISLNIDFEMPKTKPTIY